VSGELIRVTALIIVTAVLVVALRNHLGEYSLLLVIAAITVVLILILENLFGVIGEIKNLFLKQGNTGEFLSAALKALGISYIATFAADVCRDFGLSSLAQTAELTGKIAILVLSLPLITAVLETTLKFVR
jgi:stage III sporulation protein AD